MKVKDNTLRGAAKDITERKEMQDKLLQSEKLKSLGELVGGVAHDFNNVLTTILGKAQLLKMVIEPPQGEQERRKSVIELKEGLDVIEQASRDGAEALRRIQDFTIKLPIIKNAVEEEKVKPFEGEAKKARIMIIDDEEPVRNLLSAILKKGGHEVEVVSDGNRGIEIFKYKEFDLVFTDLGMPSMSGWQVAEKVKGINKKVPVVLITGWNVELNESEMRESGVDLLVYKPLSVNEVLKLVQEGMILKDRFKTA